jgi:hypothetical protein
MSASGSNSGKEFWGIPLLDVVEGEGRRRNGQVGQGGHVRWHEGGLKAGLLPGRRKFRSTNSVGLCYVERSRDPARRLPLRVMGCRRASVGITTGVPQIADDLCRVAQLGPFGPTDISGTRL